MLKILYLRNEICYLIIQEVVLLFHPKERVITNRIVVLRAEKGISQKELAHQLGVSRQTILSLEKNRYNPSLKLALDIALFFDVDVTEVFQYNVKEEE